MKKDFRILSLAILEELEERGEEKTLDEALSEMSKEDKTDGSLYCCVQKRLLKWFQNNCDFN
jgi:hypothetical protein